MFFIFLKIISIIFHHSSFYMFVCVYTCVVYSSAVAAVTSTVHSVA